MAPFAQEIYDQLCWYELLLCEKLDIGNSAGCSQTGWTCADLPTEHYTSSPIRNKVYVDNTELGGPQNMLNDFVRILFFD